MNIKVIAVIISVISSVYADDDFQVAVAVPPLIYNNASRIIDGYPANSNQFPWQAFIRSCNRLGQCAGCGGSLISRNYVLTAAHCTRFFSRFDIGLGSTVRNSPVIQVTSNVKIEHPHYNPLLLSNDVALIRLPNPISFSENIQPVRLVDATVGSLVNQDALVSGFGRTVSNGPISSILNFVGMRIISNRECARVYGFAVRSSTLCAVGKERPKQNACQGDSGGPLVIEEDQSHVQVGIVSFGAAIGCDRGYPSGFARVSSFKAWITQSTNGEI